MFNLDAVTILVDSKILLNKVTVAFENNEITAILGANGAGKSTLFKSLLGEYPLNEGVVKINDKSIKQYSLSELSKIRAYISQTNTGFFSILIYEYLQLARLQYNEAEKYSENLVFILAKEFKISHLLMRDITQLSGGELQLIEFVRAYLQLYESNNMQGKCLLLDEPASALDIKQTRLLYGHLETFKRRGGCVVIIDHDINAAANLATNIVLIKSGKILAAGASAKVFTKVLIDECFETNGEIISQEVKNSRVNKVYQV